MKYMGSKARHSKELLPIILKNHNKYSSYVEPFVGGANIIDKVPGSIKRIGADINEYLIAMMQAASNGWIPSKDVTYEQYQYARYNHNADKVMTGYLGFAMSYGGRFFEGFRRDPSGKRDYADESYRDAKRQFPLLTGIEFIHSSYDKLEIPANSIIYCDPPYFGAKAYKDKFSHPEFYVWCKTMTELGHAVFISEYEMPDGFKCIWEKKVNNSLTKDTGAKKGVERLFIVD